MRKVLLIYTGGTIGMAEDENGSLIPLDFEHLSEQIPELNKIKIDLEVTSLENPIDSSNMHPEIWVELAAIIYNRYEDYDGFVVLHGTDTMSYTASALSMMLEGINKPVIFTGSQLPIGTIRTDGKENLLTAIEIAGEYDGDHPIVPEVALYFEYRLMRGNRTRKYNTEHFDAFFSPNYPNLAEAGVNIKYNRPYIANPGSGLRTSLVQPDNNVAILKIFPGINQYVVNAILNAPNLKGVVLETFGAGNASTREPFIDAITQALKRGLSIVNVTQCYGGSVMMGRYETSKQLKALGLIDGKDITTETAVAKLMILLGLGYSGNTLRDLFEAPVAGEMGGITDRQ